MNNKHYKILMGVSIVLSIFGMATAISQCEPVGFANVSYNNHNKVTLTQIVNSPIFKRDPELQAAKRYQTQLRLKEYFMPQFKKDMLVLNIVND